MQETRCLAQENLTVFFDRHRKKDVETVEINFQSVLKKVVDELREFVPSDGIYILLDDPTQFSDEVTAKTLVYVAGCGEKAIHLVGRKTLSIQGLISQVYLNGVMRVIPRQGPDTTIIDKIHLPQEIKDVVCVPLKIATSTIGVVVMYQRQDPTGYSARDIRIINIFTSYLSMYIQSAIDSKKNKELTKRDSLTGLYNDRYFHTQLEKEIFSAERSGSKLILLFMDLDNFKSINDRYGHMVGSLTLKEVGFVLREVVQVPNATLARYGGDEYVCILPGIDLEQAVEIGQQIRDRISEKMFMIESGNDDGSFISFKGVISASIGISEYDREAMKMFDTREQKDTLVRMADRAMYDAKDLGKNRVCVAKVNESNADQDEFQRS